MPKYITKKGDNYYPTEELKKQAYPNNPVIYEQADKDPIKFWEDLAEKGITWNKKWTKAYEEKFPHFEWFVNGKLNVCYNCLDRHLKSKKDKTALIFIPELKTEKPLKLTYKELYEKVNKFANVLKKHGVKKQDVVTIYLPLIPEVVISVLACARTGAIHSVVFSAFSAESLKDRIIDGKSKLLITADGYYRRGEQEDLLKKAEAGIKNTPIKKVIVTNRLKRKINKKYLSWEKEISEAEPYFEPEIMNSKDYIMILYTSGTTGKPKGVVHDIGGYITQAYWTTRWNFNIKENSIFWCTADIGWITGHTYMCYGPLSNGITTLIFEGALDYPTPSRIWEIIDENKVDILYTAPTALRILMRYGDEYITKLDSLRILGTVGEPIDAKTWLWYFEKIGKSNCPVIDTWWQTETGGNLINQLPGIGPFKPSYAGRSFPGTRHAIIDEKGDILEDGKQGFLVQLSPFFPGLLTGVWQDPVRYKQYWKHNKYYFTSDNAFHTKDGFRILGRADDIIKVAGHRISTAEIENAIYKHKAVSEAAISRKPDKIKGEVPIAFVKLKQGIKANEKLKEEIIKTVDEHLGPVSKPKEIYFVSDLPKTRSGKIMRRIMKCLLNNEPISGISTLVNPDSIEEIKKVLQR